ncbi:MAG TPA: hypothetical protein VMB03_34385 [Bryobacteraceae bacterium]|nr:hypothetical protein [Bryobacteraceae bacterium]
MRVLALIALAALLAPLAPAADNTDKLTLDDRVELTRGLMAEYANAKVLVPRSKKPLEFNAQAGTYDKKAWIAIARESGPAARSGDLVQITKVDLFEDHIVLQINNGYNGGRHWYRNMQVTGTMGNTVPLSNSNDSNAPGGTSIVLEFHKSLAGMKAVEVKKLLAPVLDFDRHSVTEIYSETLPPEVRQAIKDKHATVGMDRDQVRMALGQPTHKERQTRDGVDYEDWIFGTPPGKIVFVTFEGEKVVKVKEDYAGLGTDVGVVKQ